MKALSTIKMIKWLLVAGFVCAAAPAFADGPRGEWRGDRQEQGWDDDRWGDRDRRDGDDWKDRRGERDRDRDGWKRSWREDDYRGDSWRGRDGRWSQWSDVRAARRGHRLIREGHQMVAEGQRMVHEGQNWGRYRMIRRGERLQWRGQAKLQEGRQLLWQARY